MQKPKLQIISAALFSGAVILMSAIAAGAPINAVAALAQPASPAVSYADPTYSSPIALSWDKAYVWVVNPKDDSVSVISTATDTVVAKIPVGDEPQSVALDPNGQYAFVANAASNTVSLISSANNPTSASVTRTWVTGAEPWNIVISPDGKRVYVANSVQDTITIINSDATYGLPTIISNVELNTSACNAANPNRHFQPRGMAITADNTKLYVTRFLSFVKSGGTQANDLGKEGLVCRLDINTNATTVAGSVTGWTPITLQPQSAGFNDPNSNPTSAYPNQMQSIVIRGDRAYLPNIAASPAGPLRFNVDTHAFVNAIGGVTGGAQTDLGALNLHLGARVPEAGKERLFFANVWAIGFTNQSGTGNAYVVSSGSDLLVKLNVDASGVLTFTNSVSTTRHIDLNDPDVAATAGANAGKHPLGIVIKNGVKAYVMNHISRNVSVVDLTTDAVSKVIKLTDLPAPGSKAEQLLVGAEIFFSSRGHFEDPGGATVSLSNRLSSEGWQSCSSCHFNGWTDGEIWAFAAGPRKSVPLNGSFNPHNPNEQRILNYSAIFDEIEDLELNIRNVSGPGNIAGALSPNHGLLISDTGNINFPPAVINAFARSNAGRQEMKVRLPGSNTSWPALTAMKEWVRLAIRTPNGALSVNELTTPGGGILPNPDATGGLNNADLAQGRTLFFSAGCHACHSGGKWSKSTKDFTSPPAGSEISTEGNPLPITGNPISTTQYLNRFLVNINSFNLNVAGQGNTIAGQFEIGAVEKNERGFDALGIDYNGDGKGIGFNTPSLLGIWHLPPYYHNGACETLACVLANVQHRTAGLKPGQPDPLASPADQAKVVAWLKTLDAQTALMSDVQAPLIVKQQ